MQGRGGLTKFLSVHLPQVVVHVRPLSGKNLLGSDLVEGLLEQITHAPQLTLMVLLALDSCSTSCASSNAPQ